MKVVKAWEDWSLLLWVASTLLRPLTTSLLVVRAADTLPDASRPLSTARETLSQVGPVTEKRLLIADGQEKQLSDGGKRLRTHASMSYVTVQPGQTHPVCSQSEKNPVATHASIDEPEQRMFDFFPTSEEKKTENGLSADVPDAASLTRTSNPRESIDLNKIPTLFALSKEQKLQLQGMEKDFFAVKECVDSAIKSCETTKSEDRIPFLVSLVTDLRILCRRKLFDNHKPEAAIWLKIPNLPELCEVDIQNRWLPVDRMLKSFEQQLQGLGRAFSSRTKKGKMYNRLERVIFSTVNYLLKHRIAPDHVEKQLEFLRSYPTSTVLAHYTCKSRMHVTHRLYKVEPSLEESLMGRRGPMNLNALFKAFRKAEWRAFLPSYITSICQLSCRTRWRTGEDSVLKISRKFESKEFHDCLDQKPNAFMESTIRDLVGLLNREERPSNLSTFRVLQQLSFVYHSLTFVFEYAGPALQEYLHRSLITRDTVAKLKLLKIMFEIAQVAQQAEGATFRVSRARNTVPGATLWSHASVVRFTKIAEAKMEDLRLCLREANSNHYPGQSLRTFLGSNPTKELWRRIHDNHPHLNLEF